MNSQPVSSVCGTGFGYLLWKNRDALTGADDDRGGLSLDLFKRTVKAIEPQSLFTESFLEDLYTEIDSDRSGEITVQELLQHVLSEGRKEESLSEESKQEMISFQSEVRSTELVVAAAGASDGTQEWWRGGPGASSFTCLVQVPA